MGSAQCRQSLLAGTYRAAPISRPISCPPGGPTINIAGQEPPNCAQLGVTAVNVSCLAVVGGDVENQLRVVGHAGDVDRHEVLADLLPLHCAGPARRHVEHFRPQPADTRVSYTAGKKAVAILQWPAGPGWMVVSLSFCKCSLLRNYK